uniref:RRM domain-containing protein n=1 Tax=Arcella intermedia TaxID=1963864 RepID=A0A6B2LBZ1_9EUKA
MGNIDPYMDENYVRGLFFGEKELTSIKVIRDKVTGFPAGYGFLEFSSHSAASKILEKYNGKPMPGPAGSGAVFRLNWAQYSETAKIGTTTTGTTPIGSEFSIFVGDLSPEVSENQLQKAFTDHFPSVLGVRIVMDPATGVSRGYGFVRFASEEEGREALITMQGVFVGSRPIRVSTATPKKQQSFNPFGDDELVGDPSMGSDTAYPPYYGYNSYYPDFYYGYYPDSGEHSQGYGNSGFFGGDVNVFTRPFDVTADNYGYTTRRFQISNLSALSANRRHYYLSAVDAVPYTPT